VQVFVDCGLKFSDRALLAVLLEDAETLKNLIQQDSTLISQTRSLRSAFTPLYNASLLHVCAEFNHLDCAQVLVDNRADINASAGVDENGFGGQTPIFHTVNQILNNSIDILHFFLLKNADLKVTVAGFVWGKGYLETFIPSG
jgi:hypothetical protein